MSKRVFLLLLVAIGYANAGQLISLIQATLVVPQNATQNVSYFQQYSLTWKCSDADPNLSIQIGDFYYLSECSPPSITYDTTAVAAVPTSLKTYVFKVAPVGNPTGFVNTSNTQEEMNDIIDHGGRRRILSIDEEGAKAGLAHLSSKQKRKEYRWMDFASKELAAEILANMTRDAPESTRRLLGFLDFVGGVFKAGGDFLIGIGCAIADSACKDGNNDNNAAEIAHVSAEQALANAQVRWAQNISAVVTAQGIVNTNVLNTFTKQQQTLEYLNNYTTSIAQGQDLLAAEFVAQGNRTQAAINAVSQDIANTASFLNAEVQQLRDEVVAWALLDQQRQQNFSNDVTNNNRLQDLRLRDGIRLTRTVQKFLYNSFAGVNTDAAQVDLQLFWMANIAIHTTGRFPFIDPASPGSPPIPANEFTDTDLRIFVDLTKVNFVNKTTILGSTQTVHQVGLGLWCNIDTVIEETSSNSLNWEALLELVGPVGCVAMANATNVDPVRVCRCWYEVSHKSCVHTADGFRWTDITSTTDRNAYTIAANPMCNNVAPASDFYDGRVMDSNDDLFGLIGSMCRDSKLGLITNSAYQIVNERSGVIPVDENTDSNVCSINLINMFRLGLVPSNTMPYSILANWVNMFQTLDSETTIYISKRDGVRYRGPTTILNPMEVQLDGSTAKTYQTAVTGIDGTTQIVYRLSPNPFAYSVRTRVYDQPPDCVTAFPVCIPHGNLIRDENTASVLAVVDGQDGIFDSTDIIFGPEFGTSMSSVNDAHPSVTNASPNPGPRMNTINYLQCALGNFSVSNNTFNPTLCNLADWEAQNQNADFNHFVTESCGFWDRPVVQNQCVVIPGMAFNKACNMLANFKVDATSNQRKGHMTFNANKFTQLQTINVNAGELLLRVSDGCPDYSVGGGAATGTYIHLVNSLGVDLSLRLSQTNSDPTCPAVADLDVGIPAKQFWDLALGTCGNITVTVFARLATAPGALKLCGPPISAFVPVATQSDVSSSGQFNVSIQQFHDQLNQSSAAFSVTTLGYLLQAVQYFVTTPGATVANFTAGNGNFSAFFASLTANAGGIKITNDEFYQAFLNITTVREEIKVDLDTSQAASKASIANVSDSVAVVNTLIVTSLQPSIAALVVENTAFQAESEQFKKDLAARGPVGGDPTGSGCSSKDFPQDVFCYIFSVFEIIGIIIGVGLLAYVIYYLYKYCKKQQEKKAEEEARKKEADEIAEDRRSARRAAADKANTKGRPYQGNGKKKNNKKNRTYISSEEDDDAENPLVKPPVSIAVKSVDID